MVQKIASVFLKKKSKKKSTSSVVLVETPQIKVYSSNPGAYLHVNNMNMSNKLLLVKIDHFLQTAKEIRVPLVKTMTWNVISEHNPRLIEIKEEVEFLKNQKFLLPSLNIVAEKVAQYIKEHHLEK